MTGYVTRFGIYQDLAGHRTLKLADLASLKDGTFEERARARNIEPKKFTCDGEAKYLDGRKYPIFVEVGKSPQSSETTTAEYDNLPPCYPTLLN